MKEIIITLQKQNKLFIYFLGWSSNNIERSFSVDNSNEEYNVNEVDLAVDVENSS